MSRIRSDRLAGSSRRASSDRPIPVALIGVGNSGRFYHLPHLSDRSRFDLKVVVAEHAASAADTAHAIGAESSVRWQDAVARPDVELVVIALPHVLHHPVALEALRNGKHVLVEKPMTSRLADARELVDAAASAGLRLFVHQQRRWEADFQELMRLVSSGDLGEVWRIEVARSHQGPYRRASKNRPHDGRDVAEWPRRRASGGGIAELIGPHPVDQLLTLAGTAFTSVSARAHIGAGEDVEDWIGIEVGFHPALTGRVEVFRRSGIAPPRFRVYGMHGTAVATDGTTIDVVSRDAAHRHIDSLVRPGILGEEIYRDVYETLRRGAEPRVTAEQARDVVEVLELARVSATSGGRTQLRTDPG